MRRGTILAVLLLLALGVTSTPLVEVFELQEFSQFATGQHEAIAWQNTPSTLQQLLNIANDIRANPKKYAQTVKGVSHNFSSKRLNRCATVQETYISTLKGNVVTSTGLTSNEGPQVFTEAKNFLNKVKPMPAWKLSAGLTAAAYKHSQWMAQSGIMSHTGVGEWKDVRQRSAWAENIWPGTKWNPTIAFLDWIIDDGTRTRGHRTNFFSDKTQVGFGLVRAKNGKWWLTLVLSADSYQTDMKRIPAQLQADSGITAHLKAGGKFK